ncbi:hypothetical protein ACLB1M_12450 [Escherichia coli]
MTFKIFTCRQTIQTARRTREAKNIDNRRDFIIELNVSGLPQLRDSSSAKT